MLMNMQTAVETTLDDTSGRTPVVAKNLCQAAEPNLSLHMFKTCIDDDVKFPAEELSQVVNRDEALPQMWSALTTICLKHIRRTPSSDTLCLRSSYLTVKGGHPYTRCFLIVASCISHLFKTAGAMEVQEA